jgi:hypothetical protein
MRARGFTLLTRAVCPRSMACGGDDGSGRGVIVCESLDCPVHYERRKRSLELAAAEHRVRAAALSW